MGDYKDKNVPTCPDLNVSCHRGPYRVRGTRAEMCHFSKLKKIEFFFFVNPLGNFLFTCFLLEKKEVKFQYVSKIYQFFYH